MKEQFGTKPLLGARCQLEAQTIIANATRSEWQSVRAPSIDDGSGCFSWGLSTLYIHKKRALLELGTAALTCSYSKVKTSQQVHRIGSNYVYLHIIIIFDQETTRCISKIRLKNSTEKFH